MSKNTDLVTLIQGFRLYCLAEGRRPSTIRWYMGKLHIFLKWLEDTHCPLDAELFRVDHLRSFMAHLRGVKADELNPHKPAANRPLSPHTIRGYAQVLKAFFSWATQEGLIERNPAKRLVSPKVPQTVVSTFSEAQVRGLLSVIDRKSPVGFRDYCIILTTRHRHSPLRIGLSPSGSR